MIRRVLLLIKQTGEVSDPTDGWYIYTNDGKFYDYTKWDSSNNDKYALLACVYENSTGCFGITHSSPFNNVWAPSNNGAGIPDSLHTLTGNCKARTTAIINVYGSSTNTAAASCRKKYVQINDKNYYGNLPNYFVMSKINSYKYKIREMLSKLGLYSYWEYIFGYNGSYCWFWTCDLTTAYPSKPLAYSFYHDNYNYSNSRYYNSNKVKEVYQLW